MSERMDRLEFASNAMQSLGAELGRGLVGNELQRELMVASLVVKQHVMFEGGPGTGKTVLAKRLSAATGLSYGRIQGVADLTPADVIGYEMPNLQGESKTHLGPIHNDIVLVDELNRANTKAQGALNQAMAESSVTIGNKQYHLNHDKPFLVVATQNEHALGQGTFMVSDALYDRFGMVVPFGEPSVEHRKAALRNFVGSGDITGETNVDKVVDGRDLNRISETVLRVAIDESGLDFIAGLPDAIRANIGENDAVDIGGFRAQQALARLAQATTLFDGRTTVGSEDLVRIAPYVYGHRITSGIDESIAERQSMVAQAAATIAV